MAEYKQPCRHCGALLARDSRFCPKCCSGAPFADLCPACLRQVSREDRLCAGCGRPLRVSCPHCGGQTFVGERCDACGGTLLKACPNPRCGQMQFFENTRCTACGKKM
ncbi:MAG: zinc ribbon domain-containing protein [Eubacteriales bacterium]|nr:zinc ribbon domain-containing protein [Eubacteriales bacterium]